MFRQKANESHPVKEKKSKQKSSEDSDMPRYSDFLTGVRRQRLLKGVGILGLIIALPFFIWFFLGLVGVVPTLVDVFGIVGLRTPAAFTVAGLLMAAIGFYDQ